MAYEQDPFGQFAPGSLEASYFADETAQVIGEMDVILHDYDEAAALTDRGSRVDSYHEESVFLYGDEDLKPRTSPAVIHEVVLSYDFDMVTLARIYQAAVSWRVLGGVDSETFTTQYRMEFNAEGPVSCTVKALDIIIGRPETRPIDVVDYNYLRQTLHGLRNFYDRRYQNNGMASDANRMV